MIRGSKIKAPYLSLARFGNEWVPNIFFTRSRERGEFLRLGNWLCEEFGATVVERYGGAGEDDKEYWTLRIGDSDWLLMRCYYPRGISLAAHQLADLTAFESIAHVIGASSGGWRYQWLCFRRWLLAGQAA